LRKFFPDPAIRRLVEAGVPTPSSIGFIRAERLEVMASEYCRDKIGK